MERWRRDLSLQIVRERLAEWRRFVATCEREMIKWNLGPVDLEELRVQIAEFARIEKALCEMVVDDDA